MPKPQASRVLQYSRDVLFWSLLFFLPHMIDFGMSTPLTTVIVAGMFLLLMMRSASEIFSVQFSLYS